MNTKEHVLRLLEECKGKSISGNQIAKELNLSRAAIWKAIKDLRQNGYDIKASTNKGYSLCIESDLLSRQGIVSHLKNKVLGEHILTYQSLESTNQTLKKLSADGACHNTVVVSEMQTKGRGRLGRSFYSPKGSGIYMSLLFKPPHSSQSNFPSVFITTAASVAVCRAIEEVTGKQIKIKWVNDLFYNNKKICGILTEGITNFETGAIESIIIGIGINFSSPSDKFPSELTEIFGSLYQDQEEASHCTFSESHAIPTKNLLIASILDHFFDIQAELKSGSFLEEYKQRSCVLGKRITVLSPTESIPAIAVDINETGGLIVEQLDGTRKTLQSGEISIRPEDLSSGWK
ncbi:biotin--[acetyl-CoA-carboxylase] ligase [Sinanaerobacter sp. ZZT-01]|uniref:biotin--[acetyl-CoA-carboxylase] ligase n=1 Tax=Sinanaerobacter sp. ZZT-01 TaxID=3111540 RepID=UPI002D773D8D|nr:biotin--[acetyl-CoA-carboxylase] ligase [Sinanaerobacter sp. ZZT-01]WRR94983.1 biotin--[acetyl-CoA-carboxylase] ligase [Sinanaerobacter sp. ZZT-01]